MSTIALKIQTTGVEQYAPGGNATIKTMIVGGPGVGKTRWSSFWPKPFYLACESGLSSVADRRVPFAEIKNSQDMLEALTYLKQECMKPAESRPFKTVIIDTLDAFQRKVKDEWLQKHPNEQAFKGYDAWGYLDAKMQMLLTRIMNLDLNVIIIVHPTDKIVKNGDVETREVALQLDGKIKDSIFNDFDLVGWMGSYFEAEDGQRVQKRGLTFKPTPTMGFLKDRLNVTPPWMEVKLDAAEGSVNYTQLFEAFTARFEDLEESEVVGEIPSLQEGQEEATFTSGVVGPGVAGALPPVDPKEIPLVQFDKPTLLKIARDEGCTALPDGTPIKGNTLKGELVMALEAHRKKQAEAPAPEVTPDAAPASPVEEPAAPPVASNVEATTVTPAPAPVETVPEGQVNTETGEIVEPAAVESVLEALGGTVISEEPTAEEKEPEPAPAPPAPSAAAPVAPAGASTCEEDDCDVDLSGEHADLVKLSYIKFRKRLCNAHYKARRAA